MRKVALSIVGSMVVLIGAVWLVDSAQTFESYYETYQKLNEAEHMSRGWISHVIPESSYDIREIRRFSGEVVAVRFKFQPRDTHGVDRNCRVITQSDDVLRQYQCQPAGDPIVLTLDPRGEGQILSR